MHTINQYKEIIERDFTQLGEPIPQGFTLTFNEDTQLVKAFLDEESYGTLGQQGDVVISWWKDGKWVDSV